MRHALATRGADIRHIQVSRPAPATTQIYTHADITDSRKCTGLTIPVRTLEGWAQDYLEHGRAKGLARTTREVYACQLRRFLYWLNQRSTGDPSEISEPLLETYFLEEGKRRARGRIERPISKATLHHERAVLRGFLGHLVKEGALIRNEAQGIDLGRLPRTFKKPPPREAIRRLLRAPGEDAAGLRDKALFELLYSTGLRRSEACVLNLCDCDRAAATVRVNAGKGGKDRLVPIGEKALLALGRYLQKGRPALKPHGLAIFVNSYGDRLNPKVLNTLFKHWSGEAGIEPPITPHLLRHAFATHLLENGAGVRHVQAMLGHAQIETTARYTHVSFKALKDTMRRLDPRAALEAEPSSL